MANFDEMLAALHGDNEGGILSDVVGADKAPKITVTAARVFEFDEGFDKVIAYEGDVNSQIITFVLPESHDGHSLNECGNKKVRWINQTSKVEGTSILTPGAEANEYEWNVPPALFAKSGTIEFSIVVYDLDASNKIGFSWNTASCTDLSVGKSIESVGGVGDMPAQNEILIIDEDSRTIVAPVGYNAIIANSGDKNTSVVYFQTKRYIKGIDLTEHTAAAPVVHISYVLDDGGKRSAGSGSIEVVPYTSQYDGITNELVLITWRPEAGLTADSLFHGTFQTLVSFKKDEKVWNSAPYNGLRIGKPLDYTDNPEAFIPQPSYKFLGKNYSNKGDAIEINAIIAHQVHTEAEWQELEYIPEEGEVVYVVNDGVYSSRVGNGVDYVQNLSGDEQLEIFSSTKGYYYSYINITDKKIYISNTRVVPEIGIEDRYDVSFKTPDYPIGGRLCLVNNVKFDWGADGSATISAISGNVISYEGDLGFDTINEVADLEVDDYTLFVIEAPEVGVVDVRNPAINLGSPSSRALGDYSVAGGKDTLALGNYSTALGRETRAHYCATAEGRKSQAIGEHSHAQNYGTIARAKQSHTQGLQTETEETAIAASAEGKGTIATKEASHVQGRWNERDEEQKYVHIVGWGADKNNRKNIHTLDALGNACFSGDVYVGGAKKESGQKVAIQKDVDSIKGDVSLLDKKVSLLFEGLPNDLFTVDNSENYQKLVPDNALKYAFVKEIGGKTYTPKNLYDISKFEGGSGYSEGGGFVFEGKIHIYTSGGGGGWLWWGAEVDWYNGTFYNEPTPLTDLFNVEVGKTYTIGLVSDYGRITIGEYISNEIVDGFTISSGERKTFVLTEELNNAGIAFNWDFSKADHDYFEDFNYTIDLIELYEGAEVEPRDTKVTALEVVGRNRLAPNYPLLKSPITKSGVTFTPMTNGDIVLNGTSTSSISLYLVGNEVEAGGDGRLCLEEGKYFLSDVYHQNDANAYFLIKKRNAAGGVRNSVAIYKTEEYYSLGYVIYLRVLQGASFSNFVMRPYLTKGEDAPTDVPPYTFTRFEVPQEVQNLAGYGKGTEDGYNRIEWDGDGASQYIAYIDENGNKLETPLIVDTTDYFGKDNFLEVEQGGKITVINENKNAVPTTIVYQLKQN